MTLIPRDLASARMGSISTGQPNRCVTRIARVRSVMHGAIVSAVTLQVRGSTSAKTGTADWYTIGMTAPMSVMGELMTSSPGAGSTTASAVWSAEVPDEVATQYAAWHHFANSVSSCGTTLPY